MIKLRALLLMPLAASALSLPVQASEMDPYQIAPDLNQEVQSWIAEHDLSFVRSNIKRKAANELSLSQEHIDSIHVERVFTSGFYNVHVQGNQYIVDPYADYWIQNNDSDFFMFKSGAYNIRTSNAVKESLMELVPFIEKILSDYLIEYKPINTHTKMTVYAFMDLSCPFCKEFHLRKRQEWQSLGIRVVYLPFLRDVKDIILARTTAGVFCQADMDARKDLIDTTYMNGYRGSKINDAGCSGLNKMLLDFMFTNGARYMLEGSPMFMTDTGRIYYGSGPFEMGEQEKLEK